MKDSSSDSDVVEISKVEHTFPKRPASPKTIDPEIIVEASPKKRGRKPKAWHLENQRLIQQQELEKISAAAAETLPQEENVKDKSLEDEEMEEAVHHSPKKMHRTSPYPPVPSASVKDVKDSSKRVKSPIKLVSPPAQFFISPVVRKKEKKKSWFVSGYQSLESPVDQTGSFDTVQQQETIVGQLVEPTSNNIQPTTFFKKNCLPLYIITLPTSRSRYFLDIQIGLFLEYASGRAFLDSIPGISTRIAAAAEKQYLEQCAVSETIYSSMIYANESAARWIKTVSLHAGHVGLKMTDLDIHFVKEEDVSSRLNTRIKALQEKLEGDQVKFFDEIFIGKREEDGHDRGNLGESLPSGGYVHKLKRHAK